jgi:hypothetical protein
LKRLLAALAFANLVVFGYLYLVASAPPAPAPVVAAPRLELMGERHAPSATSALRCVSVGPLRDADVSQAVGEYLKGLTLTARERMLETDAPPGYWVMTTRKSAALAAKLVQQLRAAGLADVELVPPAAGKTDVQVSLGLYDDRAHAERRIQDLKGYALAPTIVEQRRRLNQWWLDVETSAAAAPVDVAALLKAVPAATGAGLGPCVLQLPPSDPEAAPPAATPPAKAATRGPGAPA